MTINKKLSPNRDSLFGRKHLKIYSLLKNSDEGGNNGRKKRLL